MADEFNLRQLVREVRATSTMLDPHLIAVEVLRRINNEDLRTALAECLPALVREEYRHTRNHGTFPHLPSTPTAPLRPVQAVTAMAAQPVPAKPRPARSAKVAAIRAAAHAWMQEVIHTSADPREWKRVGDCGVTELMFAAQSRREQARRTNAKAAEYEALAELVRAHGVRRVRDLPESVLRGVGGAAA
ncbi:hypothetical protein [Kitasatospora sp. NPDC086791]|uniref:hypothetical protein n=1 Tax=Kitasatospora sp. NPDC086791 TaxID=3155178 RepID=UPI003412031A